MFTRLQWLMVDESGASGSIKQECIGRNKNGLKKEINIWDQDPTQALWSTLILNYEHTQVQNLFKYTYTIIER